MQPVEKPVTHPKTAGETAVLVEAAAVALGVVEEVAGPAETLGPQTQQTAVVDIRI